MVSSNLRLRENDKMERAAAMWAAGNPEQFAGWLAGGAACCRWSVVSNLRQVGSHGVVSNLSQVGEGHVCSQKAKGFKRVFHCGEIYSYIGRATSANFSRVDIAYGCKPLGLVPVSIKCFRKCRSKCNATLTTGCVLARGDCVKHTS